MCHLPCFTVDNQTNSRMDRCYKTHYGNGLSLCYMIAISNLLTIHKIPSANSRLPSTVWNFRWYIIPWKGFMWNRKWGFLIIFTIFFHENFFSMVYNTTIYHTVVWYTIENMFIKNGWNELKIIFSIFTENVSMVLYTIKNPDSWRKSGICRGDLLMYPLCKMVGGLDS